MCKFVANIVITTHYFVIGIMHNGVICDSCGREDMMGGMRWECTRCCDYDLCSICYMAGKHNHEHEFFIYDKERIMRFATANGSLKHSFIGIGVI